MILNWSSLFSQEYPTKRELKKLFSEKQEYFGEYSWEICNDDRAYFTKDTIILYYRNSACCVEQNCCENVTWTFHNARKLQIGKLSVCQEPPVSSFGISENPCSIKLKEIYDKIELEIITRDDQIFKFRIEKLTQCEGELLACGEFSYQLVLTRIKKVAA